MLYAILILLTLIIAFLVYERFRIRKWMKDTDEWGGRVDGFIVGNVKGESAIGFYHEDDMRKYKFEVENKGKR